MPQAAGAALAPAIDRRQSLAGTPDATSIAECATLRTWSVMSRGLLPLVGAMRLSDGGDVGGDAFAPNGRPATSWSGMPWIPAAAMRLSGTELLCGRETWVVAKEQPTYGG